VERKPVQDLVTYCVTCGSAIYWEEGVRPVFVRAGDARLLGCLQTGCTLLAVRADNAEYFELFRSNLIDAGIPEAVATEVAALIATRSVQAAA
jgi:hypothetical protein